MLGFLIGTIMTRVPKNMGLLTDSGCCHSVIRTGIGPGNGIKQMAVLLMQFTSAILQKSPKGFATEDQVNLGSNELLLLVWIQAPHMSWLLEKFLDQ